MVKCKNCGYEFEYESVSESGMGYVKCPECSEPVTQNDKTENMKYSKITSLVPAGEFFDESAVDEGVYLTTTHLQALEDALSKPNEADAALQAKLDEATTQVTTLQTQMQGMHTAEAMAAKDARITALEAEVSELGKGASGNGTPVAAGNEVIETGNSNKKVTINDAEHPTNVAAASYLAGKKAAAASKPKF